MPVIGVERKLAIDPVSFSRATPTAVIIAGIRISTSMMRAGNGLINAFERLVVAEAFLDIDRRLDPRDVAPGGLIGQIGLF